MSTWPDQQKGADHPNAHFTREQAERMRQQVEAGEATGRQLARETGVSQTTMSKLLRGDSYQG